jgi:hypothetical protein
MLWRYILWGVQIILSATSQDENKIYLPHKEDYWI